MFNNGKMGPGKLIEMLWKLACRTPVSLISVLVFGRQTSEIYARIRIFRDVAIGMRISIQLRWEVLVKLWRVMACLL